MDEIKTLEADVERLQAELNAAKEKLHAALVAKCGVSVGDVVFGIGRHAGNEFRVTDIDARWQGKPWLRGNPRLANGEWGKSERYLYDNWERAD